MGVIFVVLSASLSLFSVSSDVPWTERPTETAQSWSCSPRRTCKQIASCDEAYWYLQNCSWGGRLDRDGDGRPCESLC
ncbi:excalibur calcium-binding domain-containing protein [Pseudaminobacter sp. 19-2017]|uniref:Excalibur calcium-binding domain-containing protein n=1 Tax=Pseudaminobacter soli (ex Zhang et al. 2022) TaxID=2831468 RepID=A0A942DZD2_9HYPH|nr:excalibur calcium-binding domain-containing protein [Pseudaminobacter soli]MBS3651009.1 excalibur calcium-binding domain-containing protein [Pseudaminobacter soli]